MSAEPTPQDPPTCCGNGPTGGAPKGGQPQTHACKLCSESGKHWDPDGSKRAALAEM